MFKKQIPGDEKLVNITSENFKMIDNSLFVR